MRNNEREVGIVCGQIDVIDIVITCGVRQGNKEDNIIGGPAVVSDMGVAVGPPEYASHELDAGIGSAKTGGQGKKNSSMWIWRSWRNLIIHKQPLSSAWTLEVRRM